MLLGTEQTPQVDPSTLNEQGVVKPKADEDNGTDVQRSERANVKRWEKRILDAKRKWQGDFDRMKGNMDFVIGLQWPDQKTIQYEKYIVNMTLRTINQRVATLYAKNPRISASRRPRLDFQLWDGDMESIMQIVQQASQMQMMNVPVPPQLLAIMADFQSGRQHQKIVEKVGKTLEIVYHYQQDNQEPKFKTQMKQLVRRVSVCGVGYIKVSFQRDFQNELTHSDVRISLVDRVKMARELLDKLEEGKFQESDAEMDTLRSLVNSLNVQPTDPEQAAVRERLVFDFPKANAIIVDENCSILRGFVGADWIAEEFNYPLDFVNAFFEKDISATATEIKMYDDSGKAVQSASDSSKDDQKKMKVKLWKVYDKITNSTFMICEGYKDYIEKPEGMTVPTKGFWQIVPVTFNDVEVIEGCAATIYPPSDVDLIRHPQLEHNRCREALRRHRKANRPRYMYPEGALLQVDLDNIASADDQEFVGLKGLQPGTEPGKVLQPLQTEQIHPELYDTTPVQEDALLATGQQEANIGPAQPNVTATVGTIAEQSRITVATSDVDSLDDSLSDVAECGGEMLLREMSPQNVKAIAGPGGVWPDQDRISFINEIQLEIVAASSGRPNKAVEIANWERVVPLILQAATLPPQAQPTMQAVIRETVKRIDDRMEPADFFPLPMPILPQTPEQQQQKGPDSSLGVSQAQPAPQPQDQTTLVGQPQQ